MGDQLSTRQLAFATWLYESRPALARIARGVIVIAIFGLCAAFLILTAFFFSSYSAHRFNVLVKTQNFIISTDPSLAFAPSSLQASQAALVKKGESDADMYGSIRNPNPSWIASRVRYYFTSQGEPISEPRETFAVPGENAVAGFVKNAAIPANVSLAIEEIEWRKIILPIDKERLNLFSIESSDFAFVKNDEMGIEDTVTGTLVNKSPFGFWNVQLIALLYDEDALAGVGEYTLQQFSSGEERAVTIGVGDIASPIGKIQIAPRVNILDARSLMP